MLTGFDFFPDAVNNMNPSIKLGEDGIDSVLVTLQAIRARALSQCNPLYLYFLLN